MNTTPEERPNGPSIKPGRSSTSVRVFWLDRPQVLERLRAVAERLQQNHPEIEQVILFGSVARGDAVPGSDADLLLVLKECGIPFLERGVRYRITDTGIDVDLVVYTRRELDAMLEEKNAFVTQALREGMVL